MTDKAAAPGEPEQTSLTLEVGDEGGGLGDLEIATTVIGSGSEADETWRPAEKKTREIVRDETGQGRRSP